MTSGGNETGQGTPSGNSFLRLISGDTFGLAQTYWTLYLTVAVLFFGFGSVVVADRNWPLYIALLIGTIAWTFLLLTGVQRAYKGSDPGKTLGRIGMLFLLLNLTNVLATFSFI